jgi:hypothetical protein
MATTIRTVATDNPSEDAADINFNITITITITITTTAFIVQADVVFLDLCFVGLL